MLRKAKEVAKDRIRSVNAARHHHHHRSPHPAKPSTRSQAQSRGYSSVSLKAVDDAFQAALNDDSDFSNPFHEDPPSKSKQVPNSRDDDDLFSDPPASQLSDDDLFDSDQSPPGATSTDSLGLGQDTASTYPRGSHQVNTDTDPLGFDQDTPITDLDLTATNTDSIIEQATTDTDPLTIQATTDSSTEPLMDQGNTHTDQLTEQGVLDLSGVDRGDEDVQSEGDHTTHGDENDHNSLEMDAQELHQDTQVPTLLPPSLLKDDVEPQTTDAHFDKDPNLGKMASSSPAESATVVEHHTPIPAGDVDIHVDDYSDELFPEDNFVATGTNEHSHVVDAEGEDDQPNIYPTLPNIEDFDQEPGLSVPNYDFLSDDSPLSSLPSSYEGEHMLTSQIHHRRESSPLFHSSKDSEILLSSTERNVDKVKCEEELTESTGSIEADLDVLLAPKPSKGAVVQSSGRGGEAQVPQSRSRGSTERDGHSHLDSGVFERECGPTPTPERDCREDSLLIEEDHFTSSSQTKPTTKVSPTKKNRLGKIAPPRPALSPKLQRHMKKSKDPSVESSDTVKVKIVQPLGTTPPDHSTLSTKVSDDVDLVQAVVSTTDVKKGRIPADDLFMDDQTPLTIFKDEGLPIVETQAQRSEKNVSPEATVLTATDTQSKKETERSGLYLPLSVHLLLAGCLYLYYSLNIFPYLAGFFAGFLMVYFLVGSVFIYYVQTEEKARAQEAKLRETVELSNDFVKSMNVRFEDVTFYQGNKFTATLTYDPATHHPSQRQKAHLRLKDNFTLSVHVYDPAHGNAVKRSVDIRECSISLVPQEVAKNRKRRWSKKFPISIRHPPTDLRVFVFSPHARDKQDWFRRMKSASQGFTSEQIIQERKDFFKYMQHYFQLDALSEAAPLPAGARPRRTPSSSSHRSHAHPLRKPERVQFSKGGSDIDEEDPTSISITKGSPQLQPRSEGQGRSRQTLSSSSSAGSLQSSTSVDPPPSSSSSTSAAATPLIDDGFELVPRPHLKLPRATLWINAMAARLCWDVWHEKRWKDWVMSRIQKKLIRVKTPSFIEQLRLTDVDLGKDMPVVKGLSHGPHLNLRGIWVYLDVVYEGRFVMTIETKMKLGAKEEDKVEDESQQMASLSGKGAKLPGSSTDYSSNTKMSHSNAARALGTSVDLEEIDSGSDEEESHPSSVAHPLEKSSLETDKLKLDTSDVVPHDTHSSVSSTSSKEGRFKSMYSIAKAGATRITKRVANTKIVRRAAEKVSSYPLILSVDVRRLEGVLAVNIPPPPTDTIWYGFEKSPKLDLVAKPKLGHREVKLSSVTHWIEKKLCELVNKKLVLPEMEDIVIPILNSGMPDLDVLKPISTDSETPNK